MRRRLSRGAALVAAVVLGTGGLLLAGAAAASADTSSGGGVGISVEIPGPTDTASPTPTDTGAPGGGTGGGSGDGGGGSGDGGGGSGDGSGGSGNGSGGSGDGSGSHGGGGSTGVDNGPVTTGGLHAAYVPSINPFGGKVAVWFDVHNGSKSTISSKARFWLTGPVGNTVSDTGTFAVPPIKPGATVRVERVLENVGQWTVLTAHARYTPPGSVDGIVLKSLVREVTIFAFPWLGAAGVVLGCTGFAIVYVIRSAGGLLAVRVA
jgi:hypothetical protein